MYRIILGFLCLTGCFRQLSAQPLPTGNEWINYKQAYVKIPVAQNGIYRITPAELNRVGLPITTIDPTTIQLFHRGVEQAIYVDGETDHRFDTTDFLEFYGQANDGAPDSLLYRPTTAQPHPYYSLFNDTTAYFLTWRLDGRPGRRMATYWDTDYAKLTPEPYYWADELRLFTDTYPGYGAGIPPKIEYSHYEAGEGYTGVIQQKDKPFSNRFTLTNAVRDGPSPQLDLLLVGRDYTPHLVECLTGTNSPRQLGSVTFARYDNARLTASVPWNNVAVDGGLTISTVSRGDSLATTDRYSVSYLRLQYPQQFNANNETIRLFHLAPNSSGRSRLDLVNVPTSAQFWDVSNPDNPVRVGTSRVSPDTTRLILRDTRTARTLLMVSQYVSVPAIRPVRFVDWSSRRPTYVIVTHETLRQPTNTTADPVQDYAAYRASTAGGGFDTLTVTMQQLIDQYSYGERHPLAIRRFMTQLVQQSNNASKQPQYLLLLGRSRSTPGIRRDSRQATLDLVMTYGFPGSDVPFTSGLGNAPNDVPAVPTGRVNAGTPQDVVNYLNKVKEYESQPAGLWRKNVLHLSGGTTPGEAAVFRSLVDAYREKISMYSLGGHITTLTKQTDNLVEAINVAQPVNEGVGLMTFFGHSGLDVTDLDIGFCSNDALGYRNKGRYPLLLINGCAIGNFFFGRPTLTTDWVLTPDRGAIAAIAHSHLGYVDYLNRYSSTFYDLLSDSTQLAKSIGQLQQETIRRTLRHDSTGWNLANCQQMVLQGDPAIRLFPFQTPDYAVTARGITITDSDNHPLTTESDLVRLRVVVQNTGLYRPGQLPIQVRRSTNGQETGVFTTIWPRTVAYSDTLSLIFPNQHDATGLNQFTVTVNPGDLQTTAQSPEANRSNNLATIEITLASPRPTLIYPPLGGRISQPNIRLTAQYAGDALHPFVLELDSTNQFSSPFRQVQRLTASGLITYQAHLPPRSNQTYFWRVRRADLSSDSTAWSTGSFVYVPGSQPSASPEGSLPEDYLPEGQLWLTGSLPSAVEQGDIVTIPAQFTNLSPALFSDSLLVRQTVYASSLASPQVTQWRMAAPMPNDTIRFVSRLPTEKLPGLNRVVITVNPRLQAEYSFLNNTLDLALPVQPDRLGPLLEVAVDGARIDNDAVVSAWPAIDILVADNNRSLIRRDTVGLSLFLLRPGASRPERLSWRNAQILSGSDDAIFRIRYPSKVLLEGTYQLLVTASDVVGNLAAPYQVSFRVVREQRLNSLVAYPNPFREQVLLSCQLTGEQAPDKLSVSICDLTGTPIRHWTVQPRIGRNEWPWDGRTDAGHPAPAGAYVYRLMIDHVSPSWSGSTEWSGRLLLLR
ncbi:C25 family cysteine peptidase [Spirosoma sp. KUDC1026]|uniref:putative type IX secretion system sortase PorU2 n=1 Tax=Spirosoma sp. KUDC1026 TaxID=2745947 RepID=UPI00159B9AF8|nr:C25 family cysteine peptidase [Spirosoma sp. KUDC1026]QKZ13334.1 hypothetical protein HU175_12100 [Spirosoma sp. KUDC1026]